MSYSNSIYHLKVVELGGGKFGFKSKSIGPDTLTLLLLQHSPGSLACKRLALHLKTQCSMAVSADTQLV